MKKLLILMPYFMGYETKLYNQFKEKYDVTLVNCDEFDHDIIDDYMMCSKFHWLFRHIFKKLAQKEKYEAIRKTDECVLSKIPNYNDYFDVVFCINGGYLSLFVINQIKERNPNAKFILYLWDDVDNLFSNSHVDVFDEVYSYNILDCKKYSWKYVPMFVQSEYIGHKDNKYDLAYIGTAHSDRIAVANKLFEKYADKYRLFIYLYDSNNSNQKFCHSKPLSYNEYLEVLSRSKTVLDLPAEVQKGPTTRIFDALLTCTKVITTNKYINLYPVFSNNILIVDREKLDIVDSFIEEDYEITNYLALTTREWIKKFEL